MSNLIPVVELIRLEENDKCGTFGVLKVNKRVFCATLELSDKENRSNVSSIPAQQYKVRKITNRKYGTVFQVMDVPNRFGILFHPGNTKIDTRGCILLGQFWGKLRDNRAVLNSGATFLQFRTIMQDYDEFHLTIKEVY